MPRGFSLLELVITLTVAGIVAVPTGILLSEQVKQATLSQETTLAGQLARYELERLDALNNFFHSDLNLGSWPANNLGYPYDVTRVVTCLTPGTTCTSTAFTSQGVKRIDVTVSKTGSTTPLAQLVTYRTKCVCFGSPPPAAVPLSCGAVCPAS